MRQRAAIVLIEDGRIALIKRVRSGRTYYVFPGGGVEKDETPVEAARSEAMEELGLEVDIGTCCYETSDGECSHYYLASITGGVFGSGTGDEFNHASNERGSYVPVWMPIHRIAGIRLFPEALKDKISSLIEQPHYHKVTEYP